MYKSYKYRIYPTKKQSDLIDKTFNVSRLVYNLALETKIRAWESSRKSLSVFDLISQLPELKRQYTWMREVDGRALEGAIMNVHSSFKGFFSGKGFPKFKGKKSKQSYHIGGNKREIDWEASTISLPKLKGIKIILSRKFKGEIKKVTVSKTNTGKYYASILVDNEAVLPGKSEVKADSSIGIDLGIKSFAVTSKGNTYAPNRYLKDSIIRLQCLQRRVSRKKKGSSNRKKANLCVAILHEKIANQRADYIHKITSELVRDSQANTFVIEDLNVAGMVKNRKLSRAISDASFGEFRRQMTYKCDWYGKNLILIDRFAPSSKRCSDCGIISDNLTLDDRSWTCLCGASHDRDFNAAKNIKWYGLNNSGQVVPKEPVEMLRLRRSMKQEGDICHDNKLKQP